MEEANVANGVGNFLLGAGGLGGMIWAIYERVLRLRVERADHSADIAASGGETAVYKMLTERLESLEGEVKKLRDQLVLERETNFQHQLNLLAMRKACIEAGITLPELKYGHSS